MKRQKPRQSDKVPPGLQGPSLSKAESPGPLAIQPRVSLSHQPGRVLKTMTAAAGNGEGHVTGAAGGYFGLCLRLQAAVGLVPPQSGRRAGGGELFWRDKRPQSLHRSTRARLHARLPASELHSGDPGRGRSQARGAHTQSRHGARGEGGCPMPGDTGKLARPTRPRPVGGQREPGEPCVQGSNC